MKKLVCSALALSLTSAVGVASGNDWSTLDREVEALTASLGGAQDGPQMFGRIRALYYSSSDVTGGVDANGAPNDLGGFDVVDSRFGVKGDRGDYSYKVQVDFADAPILLDAYMDFPIGGTVKGRFGQFKSGIARSSLISSAKMAWVQRSHIGALFSRRTEGIMVYGEFDQLGWSVSVQDGADGNGDDLLIAGRVTFDVLGNGKDMAEGAYAGSQEPSAEVGLAYFADAGADVTGPPGGDADGILVEFHGGTNVYSFGADVLDIGDVISLASGSATDPLAAGVSLQGDTTPFSVFGTYMLQPDTWEVALRYQDYDNLTDETKIDLAFTNYIEGHNLKWTFQFSTIDSDLPANEVDALFLQLQVGF